VPLDVQLTDRLAEDAVHQRDATPPALALLRGAAQSAAVEREVLLDQRRRQIRRGRVHHAPGQPVPPVVQVDLLERLGESGQVVRLADDDRVEDRLGAPSPRSHADQSSPGAMSCNAWRSTRVYVATASRVRTLSQWDAASRVSSAITRAATSSAGRLVGPAGQTQHGRHVCDVGRPHLLVAVVAVERLVGQADPDCSR
jgi:hypothetical protein